MQAGLVLGPDGVCVPISPEVSEPTAENAAGDATASSGDNSQSLVVPVTSSNVKVEITPEYIKNLYIKTDEEWNKNHTDWSPPPAIVEAVKKYFEKHPFAKLRYGLLKIKNKEGDCVWFELNEEQRTILDDLEEAWNSQQPFNAIMLKARQVGLSTFCCGANWCFISTHEFKSSHIMSYLQESSDAFIQKLEFFCENEPCWLKKTIIGRKPFKIGKEKRDKGGCDVRVESSERREKVGRSFTFQFSHMSEGAFYPPKDQDGIISSILKVLPDGWPRISFEESTGRVRNDSFHLRFMRAYEGKLGKTRAYFFPFQDHKEYRLALPKGMSVEKFLDGLADRDKVRMETYGMDVEQIHWYVTKRSEEMNSEDMTEDMFMREYPCCIDECFVGVVSNYFESAKVKRDQLRLAKQVKGKLTDLAVNIVPVRLSEAVMIYAQCELYTDHRKKCLNPVFMDSDEGFWKIWEKPNDRHVYVIPVDVALGKSVSKMAPTNTDFSVIDIWRISYNTGDAPVLVQVAQYRNRAIQPRELAQEAVAASCIYHGRDQKALIIMENNAHGLSGVEEAKSLEAFQYHRKELGKNGEVVSETLGFMTTGGTVAQGAKNALYSAFRKQWNHDKVLTCSTATAMEMGTFANLEGTLGAIGSSHDDTITAGSLMVEGIRYLRSDIEPIEVAASQSEEFEIRQKKINVMERRRKIWGSLLKEKVGELGGNEDYY